MKPCVKIIRLPGIETMVIEIAVGLIILYGLTPGLPDCPPGIRGPTMHPVAGLPILVPTG